MKIYYETTVLYVLFTIYGHHLLMLNSIVSIIVYCFFFVAVQIIVCSIVYTTISDTILQRSKKKCESFVVVV